MTDMVQFSEEQTRADLARLLTSAVEASGCTRCDIARGAKIHRDALRRILTGKRSATLEEASRILQASGVRSQQALTMFLLTNADQSSEWQGTQIGRFLEDFLTAMPVALACELGSRLQEVRPRWAKGTAHRIARLLSDHIEELERKDVLLGDAYDDAEGAHHG
jgi:plasmid maintenance system antidote protein VapI